MSEWQEIRANEKKESIQAHVQMPSLTAWMDHGWMDGCRKGKKKGINPPLALEQKKQRPRGEGGGGIVFQMSCFDKGFPTRRCILDPACIFSL